MAGAFQSDAFERDAFQEGTSLTAADAVTTSDAPTRTQVLVRSATDAVTSSDTVVRAGQALSASDAVSTSDGVAGARAVPRTASDTVTSSASPTRSVALVRTAADLVTSSDANIAIRTVNRTAADTVTSSDAPTRILDAHRTVSNTVTISSSIARSGSFTYTISDNLSTLVRAGAAFPVPPPPTPGTEVDIAIYVAGVNITADVVFESCRFTSYVNGKPGDATMRVRDSERSYAFTTGADWLVMVNGDAAWRGFLVSKIDTYIAPALNVTDFGPTRFFDLVGADMNLLFGRRVVYDQRNPTNVTGTQFQPGTADTTAITELLDNWLLLTDDQLDTSTGVTHVGSLDPAQVTRAWSGGWYWGNAMDTIAMLPAAIYYLRPEYGLPKATLCYVDVDIPTAPFGLSDIPDGISTMGYREMEITLDGTSMANDVMAWGMGYGSTVPVFDRETDSTSQADHGLWQTGVIANGVYKQATIDRIATSIIDGSPSSKRGAKNDKPSVRLVTYDPGLLAGHVVSFTSNIWGYADAIPVRQMTLLFEAPDVARYEIVLSHEIDAPWGFIDQFWPDMSGSPQIPCLNPPCYTVQPPGTPQTTSNCDQPGTCHQTPGSGTATWTGNGNWEWQTGDVWSQFTGGVSQLFDSLDARNFYYISLVSGINRHATAAHISNLQISGFTRVGAVDVPTAISFQIFKSEELYGTSQPSSNSPAGTLVYAGVTSATSSPTISFDVPLSDTDLGILRLYLVSGSGAAQRVSVIYGPTPVLAFDYYDETNNYTAAVLATTPVTYTHLANTSGGFTDETGNLAWNYSSGSSTRGAVGPMVPDTGAITLSGGGFPRAPDVPALEFGNGPMTLMAWIKPTGLSGNQAILQKQPGAYYLRLNADKLQLVRSQQADIGSSTTSVAAGVWTHVTLAYDGSNGPFRFYINGVADADINTDPSFVNNGFDLLVGIDTFGGEPLLGSISDVALWSRTLSRTEVATIYAARLCNTVGGCGPGGGGPIPPQTPTSPGAWGCENPTRTSSTIYTARSAFVPQTTFVWRDGLFQRRGTDFTEGSGNQTVVFAVPVTTEVIRMCYFAQGPAT